MSHEGIRKGTSGRGEEDIFSFKWGRDSAPWGRDPKDAAPHEGTTDPIPED